jgi:hypothetical protein
MSIVVEEISMHWLSTSARAARPGRAIVAALVFILSCGQCVAGPAKAAAGVPDPVAAELAALGKRGEAIIRARDQVLAILETENSCTAWFEEYQLHPAEVFRTLHYQIEFEGTSRILRSEDDRGNVSFKHPWGARVTQSGGSFSVVQVNAYGPFFIHTSPVFQVFTGNLVWPNGFRALRIESYGGNSPGARVVILLHEFAHVIDRIPEDDDSWDGRSSRNTMQVLAHCRHQIETVLHESASATR